MIQPRRAHSDHVAAFIHERPPGVSGLHRHTDLIVARVVPDTGHAADFPPRQFRLHALEPWIWETDGEHRLTQFDAWLCGYWQRPKRSVHFQHGNVNGPVFLDESGCDVCAGAFYMEGSRTPHYMLAGDN